VQGLLLIAREIVRGRPGISRGAFVWAGTQRPFPRYIWITRKAVQTPESRAMKQVFDQLLKFLQQGISSIFHFVELIWTWTVDQISKLMAVPWQEWPLLKQVLLLLILAGVLWSLYRAGWALLEAGAAILAAFAGLLAVLVQTLPHVFLAGVIALGGVWLVNHLDNSSLRMPTWMQASEQNSVPQNQNNQNNSPQNQTSVPQKSSGSTPQSQ
jgi:hypothetical protein